VTHRLISDLSEAPLIPCPSGVILRTTVSCFYVSEVKERKAFETYYTCI